MDVPGHCAFRGEPAPVCGCPAPPVTGVGEFSLVCQALEAKLLVRSEAAEVLCRLRRVGKIPGLDPVLGVYLT